MSLVYHAIKKKRSAFELCSRKNTMATYRSRSLSIQKDIIVLKEIKASNDFNSPAEDTSTIFQKVMKTVGPISSMGYCSHEMTLLKQNAKRTKNYHNMNLVINYVIDQGNVHHFIMYFILDFNNICRYIRIDLLRG